MGGSASQVRDFVMDGIPFPALLNLLSSASNSGYISREGLRATVYMLSIVTRHDYIEGETKLPMNESPHG